MFQEAYSLEQLTGGKKRHPDRFHFLEESGENDGRWRTRPLPVGQAAWTTTAMFFPQRPACMDRVGTGRSVCLPVGMFFACLLVCLSLHQIACFRFPFQCHKTTYAWFTKHTIIIRSTKWRGVDLPLVLPARADYTLLDASTKEIWTRKILFHLFVFTSCDAYFQQQIRTPYHLFNDNNNRLCMEPQVSRNCFDLNPDTDVWRRLNAIIIIRDRERIRNMEILFGKAIAPFEGV